MYEISRLGSAIVPPVANSKIGEPITELSLGSTSLFSKGPCVVSSALPPQSRNKIALTSDTQRQSVSRKKLESSPCVCDQLRGEHLEGLRAVHQVRRRDHTPQNFLRRDLAHVIDDPLEE